MMPPTVIPLSKYVRYVLYRGIFLLMYVQDHCCYVLAHHASDLPNDLFLGYETTLTVALMNTCQVRTEVHVELSK